MDRQGTVRIQVEAAMRYLLDTNIWIFYPKNSSSPVGMRLRNTLITEIAVCSIVWAELLHGARKYEKRSDCTPMHLH